MWVERPNDDAARIPRRPDADAEPNGSAERNADPDADTQRRADGNPDANADADLHADAASRHRWLTHSGAHPDDHRSTDRRLADPGPNPDRDVGRRRQHPYPHSHPVGAPSLKRILSAAALAAMLAGCSGGGHSLLPSSSGSGSSNPGSTVPVSGSKGTATVIAHATTNAGALPQMYARTVAAAKRTTYAKLKTLSTQITSVEVDGTLYQGSASAVPVTNTQTVPLSASGTITVSETFSNVIAANNDWVVFAFYTIASDGSKSAIGSLGTFVNVGTGTTQANLSAASTQELQVATALLSLGALSTYDIENTATLASDLATKITATGDTPNAQTGLYDNNTLVTMVTSLATAYERDVTITASGATEFSVVYDSSKADENDLAYNAQQSASALGVPNLLTGTGVTPAIPYIAYSALQVVGAPVQINCTGEDSDVEQGCNISAGSVPLHSPSSGYSDAQPAYVQAEVFENTTGTITIKNVYGGHIVIGAHNGLNAGNSTFAVKRGHVAAASTRHTADVTTQAYGANLAMSGEAPGASSQTLALANTIVGEPNSQPYIIDPQDIAFNGYLGFGYFGFQATALPNAAGVIPTYAVDCVDSCDTQGLLDYYDSSGIQFGQPTGSNSEAPVTIDGWNPFGITPANITICAETACAPLSSATAANPVNVENTFEDPGTNFAVYGWTAGAGTMSIAAGTYGCCGEAAYVVTYSIPANNTAAVTGTVTGSDTENLQPWFDAHANVSIQTTMPYLTALTLTVTDTNGNTYTATNSQNESEDFTLTNAQPFVFKSFSLTYTIPANDVQNAGAATTGSFDIIDLEEEGYSQPILDGCC
jgi:hypothetical protein